MQFTGWPSYVNRRIIDSTNVTVGEGGVIAEAIEGSSKTKRRVTEFNTPDKYSVTMHFDCYQKLYVYEDGSPIPNTDPLYGTTEKERFFNWFKGVHKYGTVPFDFPAILWNSNAQESFNEDEVARGAIPTNEYYIIESAAEGTKHGDMIAVTMTWKTFSTNEYEVEEEIAYVNSIDIHDGYAIVHLDGTPVTTPSSANFSVTIGSSSSGISVYPMTGDSSSFFLVYSKVASDGQTVTITLHELDGSSPSFSKNVNKGE